MKLHKQKYFIRSTANGNFRDIVNITNEPDIRAVRVKSVQLFNEESLNVHSYVTSIHYCDGQKVHLYDYFPREYLRHDKLTKYMGILSDGIDIIDVCNLIKL